MLQQKTTEEPACPIGLGNPDMQAILAQGMMDKTFLCSSQGEYFSGIFSKIPQKVPWGKHHRACRCWQFDNVFFPLLFYPFLTPTLCNHFPNKLPWNTTSPIQLSSKYKLYTWFQRFWYKRGQKCLLNNIILITCWNAIWNIFNCDLVIYSKKCVFGLHPHSCHRALKTLGIPQVLRVIKVKKCDFCYWSPPSAPSGVYVNEVTQNSLLRGLVIRATNQVTRGFEISTSLVSTTSPQRVGF